MGYRYFLCYGISKAESAVISIQKMIAFYRWVHPPFQEVLTLGSAINLSFSSWRQP